MSAKKAYKKPQLRTEQVQETLSRPACNFKNPGQGGPPRGQNPNKPSGPAFS